MMPGMGLSPRIQYRSKINEIPFPSAQADDRRAAPKEADFNPSGRLLNGTGLFFQRALR